jgi:hypothetical protein
MFRLLAVQLDEVSPIERQNGSVVANSQIEDLRIGDPLARPTSLLDREDIVPESPQFLHDRKWEILVRVEPGHD